MPMNESVADKKMSNDTFKFTADKHALSVQSLFEE